jgi:hypothetical protein
VADPTLFTLLARGRNLKVSTFLLYQAMAQWKDIGFPNAAEILPSVCRLQGHWRPTSFNAAKDLAIRAKPIDPMGMLFREHVKSIANGESATDTLTHTWSETQSRAASLGTNEGASSGSSWGESASLDALGVARGSARNAGGQMSSSSGRTSSVTNTFASLNGTSEGRSMGRSITNTLAEMLIRIPTDEQLTLHAQRLMRQREHRATWLYEGKSVTVDMYPPRQYAANLFGLPLDAWYAEWRRTYYASRAERRVPFVRQPILVAGPARPAPSISPAGAAAPARPATPTLRLVPPPVEVVPTVVAPVEHRAFPSFPLAATGLAKTVAVLQIAHVVRLLTVNHVIALTGWSYDKAYRELDACAEAKNPLLDRIKPPAARGQGSAPTIYILAPAGARLLAAHGGDERELFRIVKNNADHRRVVEDPLPHQGRHRLYGATLLTFLAAAAHTRDLRVIDIRGDREVFDPIDLTPFVPAMQERERPDPTRPVRYVPDLAFTLSGPATAQRCYVEIETGFGQRDERFLARVKAWKIRALAAARGAEMPRVLVWTRTASLEDQFVEGATAVLSDAAGFVFTTNGEALPLATPPGINQRERAESVRIIAAHAAGPVWRAMRDPKGAREEILG